MNTHFRLFACCQIVEGFTRSIIYDLQRKEYHFIPNSLHDILSSYKEKSIPEIKLMYDEKSHAFIDNFFQYLFDKELAFPCTYEDIAHFPDMETNWETPCILENFILDVNEKSNHDFSKIIEPLSQLALKVLQLRFFYAVDMIILEKILLLIKDSDIRTIELIIPDQTEIIIDSWLKFAEENMKITCITIYNSPQSNIRYHKQATIIQIKENITSHRNCGKISKDNFTCNINLYSESLKFNTCLNCKASIDTIGEIKNCPSMKVGFGNYRQVSLLETIKKTKFQKLWTIKKDDIKVCKDCEFRYMCTDCRAYIKDTNDIYSQPAKCTYNPYIAKWEGEEGYIPIEESLKELQI